MNRECFLCGRNGADDPLDKHHIFGGAYRKKSEQYGLVVYLCHHRCHIFGEKAVHKHKGTMLSVKRYGQMLVMERQGWSEDEFCKEFGKSYLEVDG